MKQFIVTLMLICSIPCLGQESTTNSSFLTRNKPVSLFTNVQSMDSSLTAINLNLPLSSDLNNAYQSDFKSFMSNDTRLLNYPSRDFSQRNDVVFGNYMNTSFDLGNSTLNTVYIFDQQGRMISGQTSFSFGKKKRN